jgi:hypothetical protein
MNIPAAVHARHSCLSRTGNASEGCCESQGGNVGYLSRFLHFACAGPGSSPPSGGSNLCRRRDVVQKIEATSLTPTPGGPSALLLSRGQRYDDVHLANAATMLRDPSVATLCPSARELPASTLPSARLRWCEGLAQRCSPRE